MAGNAGGGPPKAAAMAAAMAGPTGQEAAGPRQGPGGRRRLVRLARWAGLVVFLLIWPAGAVIIAPAEVNGAAYLAGVGPSATFVAVSQHRSCGKYGCQTVTDGVLEYRGTKVSADWGGAVPPGQSFSVREPVWTWGTGTDLVHGTVGAAGTLAVGLLFDLAALGVLVLAYAYGDELWRRWQRRQAGQRDLARVRGRADGD